MYLNYTTQPKQQMISLAKDFTHKINRNKNKLKRPMCKYKKNTLYIEAFVSRNISCLSEIGIENKD